MRKPEFRIQIEKGEFYWILKSSRGMNLARSCNNFTTRGSAKKAIETAKMAMAEAELADPPKGDTPGWARTK